MPGVEEAFAAPGALSSRRGLRNAAVYAAATSLRGGLGFVLLPFYTRALTPSEYGRVAIVLTITTAAGYVFTFGLDLALFRGFFRLTDDPAGQRRLVNSLWTFVIIASCSTALVVSATVAPWLSSDGIVRPVDLTLGLLSAALLASATTVPLALIRAQQRLRQYVVLSSIYAVATAAITLFLIVGLRAGVRGWFIAMLIANAITFAAACRMIPFKRPSPLDRQAVRAGLALGLPLIPHLLGHWSLLLADRAVLGGIVTTAAVGVYTLGATMALPAMILVQALGQAFMPSYAAAATNESARSGLPSLVTAQAVSVLLICLLVALLGPNLVSVVAPPEYHQAAPLIPWFVLGYAFLGLYSIPMNGLSLGMGRTRYVWVATAAAATTNIVLIYVLVPTHGILSAAIASAVGYLVLLVLIGRYSWHPRNPVRYEWTRLARAVTVVGVVYAGATLTTGDGGALDLVARLVWVLTAVAGIALSGGVAADGIRLLVARLRPRPSS